MTGGVETLTPQLPLGFSLAPGATFASYFRGPNALAVDLLQGMAAGKGEFQAYLVSAGGLGKTHLLQAACQRRGAAGGPVAYLPLADLAGLQPSALSGLEQLDLIAVDDIDAIAGDADWEAALFHLINDARATGARLLFAARQTPAELGVALPDLTSRLAWGPVLRLAALDDDEKRDALAARADELGLTLPPAVADYLMRHCQRDFAGLLARLAELDRASLATGRRLTIPFVRRVLAL